MERNCLTFSDYEIQEFVKNSNHILVKIDKFIKWPNMYKIVEKTDLRLPGHKGRDCYGPLIMLRILLLGVIYNLSDRALEDMLCYHSLFRWFCGLSSDSPTPDHSTMSRWRDRFIKYDVFNDIFEEFNKQLEDNGVELRQGAIVDATLISSYSRPKKRETIDVKAEVSDNQEDSIKHNESNSINSLQEEEKISLPEIEIGENENNSIQAPPPSQDDLPATVITKELCKDPDARYTFKYGKYVLGFKLHILTNFLGFIIALETTPANTHDIKMVETLLKKAKLLFNALVLGDKGYDAAWLRALLDKYGLKDWIMRRIYPNMSSREFTVLRNQIISKIRYIVERTIGCLKSKFKLWRSRYIGREKTHNLCIMASLAHNMIRAVNIL